MDKRAIPIVLEASQQIDSTSGCLCRYVKSDVESIMTHSHKYYEFFLVIRGKCLHIVNETEQHLTEGQLLFIRDFDIHECQCINNDPFEIINLTFSRETFLSICNFLGSSFPVDELLNAKLPPMANLSRGEFEKLTYSFVEINHTPDIDKNYIKLKARALLTHLFTNYFYSYSETHNTLPVWLQFTYEKMQEPQNFIAGTQRMLQLSGKTREHLSRCFKQYYGITPSQFVNNLRLTYAANLLCVSNLNVTDICYECGFENLSWFYTTFTKKFGVSPNKYRHQTIL